MFVFLVMHLLCICCACDFMFKPEVWKEERMSFNCFSILSQEIPARSAVEVIRKECVDGRLR